MNRNEFLMSLGTMAGMACLPFEGMATEPNAKTRMKLGLVTYLWGKDWDVPTLITNCSAAKIPGVELRVDHAHKVMPDLSAAARKEVKMRFDDSPIEIVGLGTNEQYDFPDQARLKKAIDRTKEFIRLSADVGGTGVKVKPNALHKEVPTEKTLEQIGRALDELGRYAQDFGQQIRLEVHGKETQELPNIKTIMDAAPHKNATICWNCNPEDLIGQGLKYNFNLVKNRFGDTVHVRELDDNSYPYQELISMFKQIKYKGWILLECRTDPKDKVQALIQQREIFEHMLKA
ncbi:sugar phosphate isomerase/epimerase [Dyadobacter jejuensis]|uniref:Sugar phosphate isomerase/epimerase n=1 Tax=Dyadobacter jejuensis TaxID=1082580 RepID=A0A316ANG7_9BACT|nr:TIM barrel protein [Dyadobacter jejuensis]PWJ59082.1 sugar phosphate isomerase/epimerase [Dyadobacter jejuensis]